MKNKDDFDRIGINFGEIGIDIIPYHLREEALVKAQMKQSEVAVDIGVGKGLNIEKLLQRGVKVIAVDQSEWILKIVRKKINTYKPISYFVAGPESLPIANRSVDCCFSNMCLSYLISPLQAIREFARILKPGGRVVLTDVDQADALCVKEEIGACWSGFKQARLKEWFQLAGFKAVELKDTGETYRSNLRFKTFIAYGEK